MKQIIATLIVVGFCCVGFSSRAFAQSGLDYGVRAGVDIGTEHITPLDGTTISSKVGFVGGGQLDYWFNNMWAFSAQLLFDQKGAAASQSFDFLGTTISSTGTLTANYIELPITIKVRFGDGAFRPYIYAGPTIGILLSASSRSSANGQDSTSDVKSEFTSTDFGVVGGVGVTYEVSEHTAIFLDAGYEYGISNVANNSQNSGSNGTANSRDIRIMAGILFGQ